MWYGAILAAIPSSVYYVLDVLKLKDCVVIILISMSSWLATWALMGLLFGVDLINSLPESPISMQGNELALWPVIRFPYFTRRAFDVDLHLKLQVYNGKWDAPTICGFIWPHPRDETMLQVLQLLTCSSAMQVEWAPLPLCSTLEVFVYPMALQRETNMCA